MNIKNKEKKHILNQLKTLQTIINNASNKEIVFDIISQCKNEKKYKLTV